jgi:antitoxin component of MazEF toxin-antitoxin module
MSTVLDRKRVRFRRSGGSRSITLTKAWLQRLGLEDASEADLVLTDEGITLQPARPTAASIEDEPEFATFLAFLAKQALTHPETLVDAADLYERDADLVPVRRR